MDKLVAYISDLDHTSVIGLTVSIVNERVQIEKTIRSNDIGLLGTTYIPRSLELDVSLDSYCITQYHTVHHVI